MSIRHEALTRLLDLGLRSGVFPWVFPHAIFRIARFLHACMLIKGSQSNHSKRNLHFKKCIFIVEGITDAPIFPLFAPLLLALTPPLAFTTEAAWTVLT